MNAKNFHYSAWAPPTKSSCQSVLLVCACLHDFSCQAAKWSAFRLHPFLRRSYACRRGIIMTFPHKMTSCLHPAGTIQAQWDDVSSEVIQGKHHTLRWRTSRRIQHLADHLDFDLWARGHVLRNWRQVCAQCTNKEISPTWFKWGYSRHVPIIKKCGQYIF